MPIQKIKSGRIITTAVDDYVGDSGTIFYDETVGDLRLSDGVTPGGVPLLLGGGTGASFKTIKVDGQADLVADSEDTIEIVAGSGIFIETSATSSPYKTLTISADNNVDGGTPFTVYGGVTSFDGGGV